MIQRNNIIFPCQMIPQKTMPVLSSIASISFPHYHHLLSRNNIANHVVIISLAWQKPCFCNNSLQRAVHSIWLDVSCCTLATSVAAVTRKTFKPFSV